MAVRQFLLPDLGEGLQEAEIIEWHVSEGARVVADQPLVSVETDKAVVEVPSPWSGRITTLHAAPGDVLPVGAPLADIDDERASDRGAIVGELEPERQPGPQTGPREPRPRPPASRNGVRAAPAARARARELEVAISELVGTGPGGAITVGDVERAAGQAAPRQPGRSGARRSMARAMERAHATVVPATLTEVADVTVWHAEDADIMCRLVMALCAGVAAEPVMNSSYDPEDTQTPTPAGIAIGIAVDTPNGLYVPVLAQAETLSTAQIRARLDELVTSVRERRSDPAQSGRATISLSNFGPLGGRHASLIVTPPQVAILGAGHAYTAVRWSDDGPVRTVEIPLSLTFDHRAATGGEAARFLAAVREDLERPEPSRGST